jgi:hypothetical protein
LRSPAESDSDILQLKEGQIMPQTYTGVVRGGLIVLDGGVPPPPEGTKVQVRAITEPRAETEPAEPDFETDTLAERLKSVIGQAKGLPSDMAQQHDHYLHGTPKR